MALLEGFRQVGIVVIVPLHTPKQAQYDTICVLTKAHIQEGWHCSDPPGDDLGKALHNRVCLAGVPKAVENPMANQVSTSHVPIHRLDFWTDGGVVDVQRDVFFFSNSRHVTTSKRTLRTRANMTIMVQKASVKLNVVVLLGLVSSFRGEVHPIATHSGQEPILGIILCHHQTQSLSNSL